MDKDISATFLARKILMENSIFRLISISGIVYNRIMGSSSLIYFYTCIMQSHMSRIPNLKARTGINPKYAVAIKTMKNASTLLKDINFLSPYGNGQIFLPENSIENSHMVNPTKSTRQMAVNI